MASDLLLNSSNFLRTEKEFSRPDKVLINGMASDIFIIPTNFLRNEKNLAGF